MGKHYHVTGKHYLNALFSPQSIALFGASEKPNTVGGRVFANLLSGGFSGPVYPINPKYQTILDHTCYANVESIDQDIDLVIVATPAATVPEIIRSCGKRNVKAAIVLSAGFGEIEGGKALEHALLEAARDNGIRILGPNCLGFMRPALGLNATFSNNISHAGNLALVSQSGAICTAVLDWADSHQIGLSSMVSIGDANDLDFGDILDYLALDPETEGVLLYIEGIRNARSFMSGLRALARIKPVIVIKAGRHPEGSKAALSHTGSLVGADDVFDAALSRAGVVRAYTIEQLFSAARLLSSSCRIRGNRLAIITNAGGPGVMATDCAVEQGIQLAEISEATRSKLDSVLPAHWSRNNPIDILGDATPDRYRTAVEICLADEGVDGVLVMLTPQAMTAPAQAAEAVVEAASKQDKPVLTCWMGERLVAEGREVFIKSQVPTFSNPESALQAFGFLAQFQHNQALLMQVPGPLEATDAPDVEGARLIIECALAENRRLLSGLETRAVLRAFNINMLPAMPARTPNEALAVTEYLGAPVAMKILSPDITHKSDVGGVRLGINSAQAARQAYAEMLDNVKQHNPDATLEGVSIEKMYTGANGREILIGVINDPIFGPVVTCGSGGIAVEVLRDRVIALPPLNAAIAHSMISRTRVAKLLGRFRHLPPANIDALVSVLLGVSAMVCELPEIQEMDINPLMVDDEGAWSLDARIVVGNHANMHHYSHMAVHPYPTKWIQNIQLSDGTGIVLRPIRPEDANMVKDFVRSMSPEARYFRFMDTVKELSPTMLMRFTQLDYAREFAFIAVLEQGEFEAPLGIARYVGNPDHESGEFDIGVADDWQHKGIGTRLMTCLMQAAREQGLHAITADVLVSNTKMTRLLGDLGFDSHTSSNDPSLLRVSKKL
ncbi:bifunctional acetate--CoA ligase family protein/GNAT family N-acetyltransferase [Candidatus Methylospira mobilis]|uniref:Bifunctional acetate--CoA ligase family protein/GNAT family N-acetyltransferase n=1 Tax=Candidatus Methylospira mobilis TaxID=1808979 RepID=A0A5Q0BN67_9GAMM|nr:bifunctional acetate--CoA ligase family protein/GNAT family N-acetyltransferase [Candidatus Methylospira mobilis]QFY43196.1 bifunctional acetate--CoA ligase family protein/GNAT family N-acetyltransferase [Candidatus Methylospira mobilis]